jgi:hypothetical protein
VGPPDQERANLDRVHSCHLQRLGPQCDTGPCAIAASASGQGMKRGSGNCQPFPGPEEGQPILGASGRKRCLEAHRETCLQLTLVIKKVGQTPARAVRPHAQWSWEVSVPLPAPNAVFGYAVAMSHLIDGQIGAFELGLSRHIISYARAWRGHRTRSIGPPITFRCWDCWFLTK